MICEDCRRKIENEITALPTQHGWLCEDCQFKRKNPFMSEEEMSQGIPKNHANKEITGVNKI